MAFWNKTEKADKNLKALSEKEIQKQLYGDGLNRSGYKVEVMDSSAIIKDKDRPPIEEKIDAKLKKEIGTELDALKGEFKRLKEEVERLRREKDVLEHSGPFGFKVPFLKTKHLIIIGSLVVLLAVAAASVFTIKFIAARVKTKKPAITVKKDSALSNSSAKKKQKSAPLVKAKKPKAASSR